MISNDAQGFGQGYDPHELAVEGYNDQPAQFISSFNVSRLRYNFLDGELKESSVGSYYVTRRAPVQFTMPSRIEDDFEPMENGVVIPMNVIVSTHSIGPRPKVVTTVRTVPTPETNRYLISTTLRNPNAEQALTMAVLGSYKAAVQVAVRDIVRNPINYLDEIKQLLDGLRRRADMFIRATNKNLRHKSDTQIREEFLVLNTPTATLTTTLRLDTYLAQESRKLIDYVATNIYDLVHRINAGPTTHPNNPGPSVALAEPGATPTDPIIYHQAGTYLFPQRRDVPADGGTSSDLYFWREGAILRGKQWYLLMTDIDQTGATNPIWSLRNIYVAQAIASGANLARQMSVDPNGTYTTTGIQTVDNLRTRTFTVGATTVNDMPYGDVDTYLLNGEYPAGSPDIFTMLARGVIESIYDLLWYVDFKDIAITATSGQVEDWGTVDTLGLPSRVNPFVGKIMTFDEVGVSQNGNMVLSFSGAGWPVIRSWDDEIYGYPREVAGLMTINTGGIPVQEYYSEADVRVGKLDEKGWPITGSRAKAPVRGIFRPSGVNLYDGYEDVRGRWMNWGQPTQKGMTAGLKGRMLVPYLLSPDTLPGQIFPGTDAAANRLKATKVGGVFRMSDNLFGGMWTNPDAPGNPIRLPMQSPLNLATPTAAPNEAQIRAYRSAVTFLNQAALPVNTEPQILEESDAYASLYRYFQFLVIRDPNMLNTNDVPVTCDSNGKLRLVGDIVDNYEYKLNYGAGTSANDRLFREAIGDTLRYQAELNTTRGNGDPNIPNQGILTSIYDQYDTMKLGMLGQSRMNMVIGRVTRWEQTPIKQMWENIKTLPGSSVTGTDTNGIRQVLFTMVYRMLVASKILGSINEQYLWGSAQAGYGLAAGEMYQDRLKPEFIPTRYIRQSTEVRQLIRAMFEQGYAGLAEIRFEIVNS